MNLQELIDSYASQRKHRLLEQAKVDALEEQEKIAKNLIIEELKVQKLTSAGGRTAVVTLKTTDEPSIENIDALYAHVRATGEFDLLYRRLNPKSVKERWDQGVAVPGVGKFPVDKLTIGGV